MGNNSAAATARDALRTFRNVTDVLMVGIAGGIPHPNEPDKHVRLSEIAISTVRGVMQFDQVKLSNGKALIRDTGQPLSARIIGSANRLEADRLSGKRPWEQYTQVRCEKLALFDLQLSRSKSFRPRILHYV
jgi:nucleoside phosphorylase